MTNKRTAKKTTIPELIKELGAMQDESAVLMVTNNINGGITIYIASDYQVFRDKLKATEDEGEFRGFLEGVKSVLDE